MRLLLGRPGVHHTNTHTHTHTPGSLAACDSEVQWHSGYVQGSCCFRL